LMEQGCTEDQDHGGDGLFRVNGRTDAKRRGVVLVCMGRSVGVVRDEGMDHKKSPE
jgi:hypothetical protein